MHENKVKQQSDKGENSLFRPVSENMVLLNLLFAGLMLAFVSYPSITV